MLNCRTFLQKIPPLASSFIPNQQILTAMMILWRHSWLKWRQDLDREMFINLCGRTSFWSGVANVTHNFGSCIQNVT